jgi:GT2 family glycosyltransferase
MAGALPITIAIPTYRREQVLADTIGYLLQLEQKAAEILVIDQTIEHSPEVDASLHRWDASGEIRWLRLPRPSIPGAMNRALLSARFEVVLFLDDDIVPSPGLAAAHFDAHRQGHRLVAGRVLQPWDDDSAGGPWEVSQFASSESREIDEFMGGNFSVHRPDALGLGGFDENFVRVAYRFEREFADRWTTSGGRIHFCPDAAIRHLKVASGGTRSFGDHLRTLLPAHTVGGYYYLLRSRRPSGRAGEFFGRPLRAVATRHHLRRPWWIPVTLASELSGMAWALILNARGPRYCRSRLLVEN